VSSCRTWFRVFLVFLLLFTGLQAEAGCRKIADKVWHQPSPVRLTGSADSSPADRARAWNACGLRPFPCKACGLRYAHRRKGGKKSPHSACPHPFHGAPGRTGPAGLPTSLPHPRPSAGDRYAFSTRPAAAKEQHQQRAYLGTMFKIQPPPAASQRLTPRTSRVDELDVFWVGANFDRSPLGGGFGRAPPYLLPSPARNAYWSGLTESSLHNCKGSSQTMPNALPGSGRAS
jgi:hypothetical protein